MAMTIQWKWMTDDLRWKPYTAACSAAIEAAHFLVFLLPYYVVQISVVTWCARIIIQTGSTVCLVSIGRCGTGRSFLQCSSLECNFCWTVVTGKRCLLDSSGDRRFVWSACRGPKVLVVLVVFLHVSLLSPSPLPVQIYTLHNFYYRPNQTSPLLNNKDRSLVHIQGFRWHPAPGW